MQIIIDYPWWFFVLCALAAFLLSGAFYLKNKKQEFKKPLVYILFGLRFLSLCLLTLLLFSPLIKRNVKNVDKPIIVVAQDNSTSIKSTQDSVYYKGKYQEEYNRLIEDLSDDYEVETYGFGEKLQKGISYDYSDRETDFSSFLEEISGLYQGRNLSAVVLASDGIYNAGSNPVSVNFQQNVPVYTIALGDTTIRRDALISQVNCNKTAYLGNKFPMEIIVKANKLLGKVLNVSVEKGNTVLFEQSVSVTGQAFTSKLFCVLDADKAGLQRYKIKIKPLAEETILKNNERDIFVDVLDGKQKIALIAQSPHPDISALKQSIENNQNYEVEQFLLKDMKKSVREYGLLILHQLPDKQGASLPLLQQAKEAKIPILFIVGQQTSLSVLSSQQNGLGIPVDNSRQTEATAYYNPNFSIFLLSEQAQKRIQDFPPLMVPFGKYETNNSLQALFYQRIGSVNTSYPLIAFSEKEGNRMGYIFGEGIWKWRMANFAQYAQRTDFDELISQILQYLSLKENKSRFKVFAQNLYKETENIEFSAELYNENYEPVNKEEVKMTVSKIENGKATSRKEYLFNPTSQAYYLNIGTLESGDYAYEAQTSQSGKKLVSKGIFSVEASVVEDLNLLADHSLLNTLSQNTGGKMFYPQSMQSVLKEIEKREDIKPMVYTTTKYVEFVGMLWLFIFLVLCLSAEWFLRKYYGKI